MKKFLLFLTIAALLTACAAPSCIPKSYEKERVYKVRAQHRGFY